ncbi:MAG: glucose/sorbosone dehydrogenase-like protein, partial [Segetibacter sp.]|nr:glucose/sorbosone dehydrogenase-like protein [Segetibacter sp.]
MKQTLFILTAVFATSVGCTSQNKTKNANAQTGNAVALPAPYATESTRKNSKTIGWPEGKTPVVPAGFTITKYATGFNNPRWIYVGPNGDVFIAEARTGNNPANRITLFRDADKDGKPEMREAFLNNLNRPMGMLVLSNYFYVGNTDGVYQFPYTIGQTSITAEGKKILDLPALGYNNHWTRNLIASRDGSKIYVSVGSGSNNAEHGIEHEKNRANILEINPDGSGMRVFAAGLRNPVGMDWQPGTNILWTAVNERDNLGDDLVPDYMTSVKEGGFYGWPYAYFGPNEDPRMKGQRLDLVQKTLVPDVNLGPHTASLGLAFYTKNAFPKRYINGAFIGQHGSWNRSVFSGYKVVFVPFTNGKPGEPEDFVTGFIADESKNEVYGR